MNMDIMTEILTFFNDFNMLRFINEINRHIEKSPKKWLIDCISKRLLELKFNLNHSIKSKALKYVVREILPLL